MPDPNEFTALAGLRDALRAMRVSDGYYYDLNALAVKLDPNQDVESLVSAAGPRPFIVLEVQPDVFTFASARAGLVELELPITVHWVSDSVPTDDESLMRTYFQGCADVEKAIAGLNVTMQSLGIGWIDLRITTRRNDRAVDSSLVWAVINTVLQIHRNYGEA